MAEIASAFPTAGGLYYWASKLGGPGWGWATGWFNLDRADRRHRRDRLRARDVRDGALRLLVRLREHEGVVRFSSTSIVIARRASAIVNMFQVSITAILNTVSAYWHMVGVAFIVLVLIIVPDHHQSFAYVFGRRSTPPATVPADNFSHPAFWFVFGLGPAAVAVHDHRLRRLGAHGGGDAPGLAHGRGRHVHVGRRLGRLRLDPAARRDVRDPEHAGGARQHRHRRRRGSGRVDEPDLGGGPALHLRRRAVLLPHGVGDVGVADDVRVLARRRRSGPPAVAQGGREPRAA